MSTNSPGSGFGRAVLALAVAAMAGVAGAATADGALRVELITAYNLVVDSNAGTPSSYAPRSAYIGVTFHNDGSVPLTDVLARIGDYQGGTGDTPGVYPARVHAGLTGPLSGGAFALTHEGGSAGLADATRYIASIPAGDSVTVYWLISYPQLDVYGVPTWGASVKPDDDLWLEYDVWASASEGGTPRAVDLTRKVTFRNEISASANKIFPNGANKVPDYYKDLMQQYVPSWTNANADGSVGTRIITEGIWYDLGNVGEGFDNDGDFVPDRNAWMQPVGDPSLFDPAAFRLVKTYAMVVVKLIGGGEVVLTGEDRLYFEHIPDNNGAVGYVRYDFVPLLPNARSVTTPYQEVASGYDNEKFNADYGVSLGGGLLSGESRVTLDKTADVATVSAGGTIAYRVAYTNAGDAATGDPTVGLPLVVQDTIPDGTAYVAGSATAGNTLPSGVAAYTVFYSTDGGVTWTQTEPSAATVTDLQWWLSDALAAGAAGAVRFSVSVDAPYVEPSPLIVNTAGISFGDNPPFATDDASTLVLGSNSLGDTVYADSGTGGGMLGNQIQDGTEPGIANVTVSLYADVNANGVADAADVLLGTTATAGNGTYGFSSLPDGRYVVEVDTRDADLPFGYTATTATSFAIDLDSGRTNPNAVSVLTADFGFAPALSMTKTRAETGSLREGQNVTYTLSVTNSLPGDGSGVGKPAKYRLWAKSGSTGTQQKAWETPANAYAASEPNGQYAVAPMRGADEWLSLATMSIGAQSGTVASVRVVVPIRVTQPFDTTDSLTISLRDGTATIAGTTLTTNANLLAVGTYELSYDITAARAWTWASFASGNGLDIYLVSDGKPSANGAIEVDAAALEVTSTALAGAASDTTTLDPVPLFDNYDTALLRYVSAVPPADRVATNATGVGELSWDNLGPIYGGGGRAVSVTFRVLEPYSNTASVITNTASITNAWFTGGLRANDQFSTNTATVLPAGTIGDRLWRDLNGNGTQDAGEPGIAGVTVTITPPAGVQLASSNTVTDANGYYLFESLSASGNYTITVVASTLPGGSGTPTWDYDGVGTANTAVVPIVYDSTTGDDTVLEADFGYTLQSAIRGTVWHDLDRDGVTFPEDGEDRLGGMTVRLYAADGVTLLATTNTAADGTYQFVGAFDGIYVVAVSNNGPLATGTWTRSYDTNGTNTPDRVTLTVPTGGLGIADYSYYRTGTLAIGDTLFFDWDSDGAQDQNVDEGVANITVWLYQDEDGDAVVDAGVDALVATTVTATNGVYLFANLPPGTYQVVVDDADADLPPRHVHTYDPYGALDSISVVALTTTDNLDQDFGFGPYGFGSIGDTVWYDSNGDGLQLGTMEVGISNVLVTLYADLDGDGSFFAVRTATTDAWGNYLFGSLPAGAYRVAVDTASSALPTDAFGDPSRPTTPTSYSVTLQNGNAYLDADFGFVLPGAIGDTVYWDFNGNADQDWTEPGVSNVTVRLYLDANANGVYDDGETLVGTETTGGDGKYLFHNLMPGRYVVVVDATSDALTGATLTGDPNNDGEPCPIPAVPGASCDGQYGVLLTEESTFRGADFGYQPPGVIGDFVWVDMNTNGVVDAGETGIPFVTVELHDGSGLVAATETDADGYYLFGNLADGTYWVSVATGDADFPADYDPTFDADGTPDSVATNIVVSGGHVVSIDGRPVSGADLTIDFGYHHGGTNRLSGTVGLDTAVGYDGLLNGTNPSGIAAGEYPFVGTAVYLYLCNDDGDNVAEPGETTPLGSTLTDANGDYVFEGLPNGDGDDRYVVSLAAPAPDLKLTTEASDTGALWLVNSTNLTGVTLSAYQVFAIVSERENADFAFRTATLRDYGDLPESYSTTVANRPEGPSHTILPSVSLWLGSGVTAEANGQPTSDATGDAEEDGVVALGRWVEGADGGTVVVTVGAGSGWLEGWVDFNGDGTFTNANERVVSRSVSSTENGGVHTITFDIPAGTFATDAGTVLNSRFRLYPNEPFLALPAGMAEGGDVEDHQFAFGLIGNRVWDDSLGTPNNGIQDGGETGLVGVAVSIYQLVGLGGGTVGTNSLGTVVTDANGMYSLAGLPEGDYILGIVPPSAYALSRRNAGLNRETDSDFIQATSYTAPLSLPAGGATLEYDAGFYYAPLLAVVTSFEAFERDGATIVAWEVAEEFDTLRYWLERRVDGAWVRVNPDDPAWAQSAENPYGPYRYEVADPGAAVGAAHTWRLVEEEVGGALNVYGPYTVTVGGPAADFDAWAAGVAWDGAAARRDDDPDGDGLTNFEEYLAGTDPLRADSTLRITSLRAVARGLEMRWPSVAGKVYAVEFARELGGAWLPVSPEEQATPPENVFVLPGADGGFFRIVLKAGEVQ